MEGNKKEANKKEHCLSASRVFDSALTLRGATYQYYNVKEYGNGCIILEPRELSVSKSISSRTLADMDRAVSNFKRGDVSSAIDLSDFSKE